MLFETVVIQIDTLCPFSCPQCYVKNNGEIMDSKIAYNTIEEAKKRHVKMIQITGGEPLLCDYLCDFIEKCSNRSLLTVIASSGYGLNYERLRRLEKSGLSAICISLNGFNIDIDKKSRDTYKFGIKAIELLKGSYIKTYINYVVNNNNINELEKIYIYAKRNHVEGINILKLFPSFNQSFIQYNDKLSEEQIKLLDNYISKDKDYFNIEKCLLEYWEYKNAGTVKCEEIGKSTYFVDVYGNIHPCSMCLKNTYKHIEQLKKLPAYNKCLAIETI